MTRPQTPPPVEFSVKREIEDKIARGSWIRCGLCNRPHGRNYDCQAARAEFWQRVALVAVALSPAFWMLALSIAKWCLGTS